VTGNPPVQLIIKVSSGALTYLWT